MTANILNVIISFDAGMQTIAISDSQRSELFDAIHDTCFVCTILLGDSEV